ncbi:hypothetical protein K502DRAFT_177563 [Neoconidiobolus thromboides FSU 785]|nr:hypothetical protein K502DRAFT_177563 [Neoconidiobolus thromboides FSU 785]
MAKHLSNFPNPAEDDKSSIDDLGKIQDLTFLSPKTDVYLNQALNLRFKDRQYFTKVGARLLLYINPYNDLSCFHEDVMGYYLKNNNNVNHQQELEPHIFQLCKVIYFHLKRSGIDQTLIFK